jgi:3-oxoacyl-[acyl-carrier protein] reductase
VTNAQRTVIVTGAGSGIGEAAARGFVAAGYRTVLADRDLAAAMRVAGDLGSGDNVFTVEADITSSASTRELAAATVQRFGGIDVLVNAAGGHGGGTAIEDITDEEWDRGIALNLTGAFRVAQAVVPAMKKAGRGSIVLVSSAAGRTPTTAAPGVPHYVAAKAGVIGLVKQMAVELGPFGIIVNSVAPGTTYTPRVARIRSEESFSGIAATVPLGRIATVDDQVGPIIFLASDAARYMTGTTLDVNGGRIMV